MTNEKVYPQGKLCVCSVQKKEKGFEDYRYIVCMAATKLGFHAVRNPENLGLSQENFESILRNDFPVFVLLVGNVESPIVNREFEFAKESCLPIFIFLKATNGRISSKTQAIVKNLSKVAYDYHCRKFESCEDLYELVYNSLILYLKDRNDKSAILQKGSGLAYNANLNLMIRAKKQIIIYQKTSILVLGPRIQCRHEYNFYRELMLWLHDNMSGNVEFLHVFNLKETVQELKNNGKNYELDVAKRGLQELFDKRNNIASGFKGFNIRFSDVTNSVAYVISDTNLIFVIPIEDERYTIELPAHIMKVAEIEKIKYELYTKTQDLDMNSLEALYQS